MTPLATTDLIAACVPDKGRVVVIAGDQDLVDAIERRAETVEHATRSSDVAGDVAAVVIGTPLDRLPDPIDHLKGLAATLASTGRIVATAPTTTHAALRLGLDAEPPHPDELVRIASVAWPATKDLLESCGLHPWWELPVTAPLLAGSGVEDHAVSPEVLASVSDEPGARIGAVVVVAGVRPLPSDDHLLLASLSAELAELRWTAADLHRRVGELSRDADRAAHAAIDTAQLRAEVVGLRLEAEASLAGAEVAAEYIAELEVEARRDADRLSRGFARIGSRIDDQMLQDEHLGRVHALGGRLLRALRRR